MALKRGDFDGLASDVYSLCSVKYYKFTAIIRLGT